MARKNKRVITDNERLEMNLSSVTEGGSAEQFASNSGAGREVKIGLVVLVVLVGLLGYAAYTKYIRFSNPGSETAQIDDAVGGVSEASAAEETSPLQLAGNSGTVVEARPGPLGINSDQAKTWTTPPEPAAADQADGRAAYESPPSYMPKLAAPSSRHPSYLTTFPDPEPEVADTARQETQWWSGGGGSTSVSIPSESTLSESPPPPYSASLTAPLPMGPNMPRSLNTASATPVPASDAVAPPNARQWYGGATPGYAAPQPAAADRSGYPAARPRNAYETAAASQGYVASPSYGTIGSPGNTYGTGEANGGPAAAATPVEPRYGADRATSGYGSSWTTETDLTAVPQPDAAAGSSDADWATNPPTPPAMQDGKYAVQPNDNFYVISRRLYGTGAYYRALAHHNRSAFPDINRIPIGSLIEAPNAEELHHRYPQLCPKPSHRDVARQRAKLGGHTQAVAGRRVYVVQQGDTLFDIARYELGGRARVAEIIALNRDSLASDINYLTPGMKLVLPSDEPAEATTQRPRPWLQ